jgi:hypothetical protein
MAARKPSLPSPETAPASERRRLGRIVHDHKGTAIVEWHDAPPDHERHALELERDTPATKSGGSLSIASEDSYNPYTRVPDTDRKRPTGQRTDLRKLSAWIKMMRSLEEAKKNDRDDD